MLWKHPTSCIKKAKGCHNQDKKVQEASFGRVRPCMNIPTNLPRTQDPPEHNTQPSAATAPTAEPPQTPDEEARDMLAKAIRNQAEDGPSTRRAAIRAFKHLHAIVRQHGPQLHWYMRPPKNTPPAAKVPKKLSNTGHARKNSLLSHHNSHLSCYTACPLA